MRYAALCIARFLARFARYAAFCIARFLARFLHSDLSPLRLGSSSDFLRLRSSLLTESSMNGRAKPCENSTTNTAILPLGYAFRQEYVLAPISGESFLLIGFFAAC